MQVDLAIPAVEAAVAISTPLVATPSAAATWLKDFQERTMRILSMRQLTRSAAPPSETPSLTRSIRS